ncbi:MAG: SRPBCC family protein [Frankiaceae bacterium]|nr:SRPBCC family protein [Frankiaceae bacterium]MBV9869504.1 SRPBCC family protein [Frankiaceae bacterium]
MPAPTAETATHGRNPELLARTLGWASLGLGIPQLLRPDAVDRAVGVGEGAKQRAVTTFVGMRELTHAAALLASSRPSKWVWTRVAGDAVDLATLGRALKNHDGKKLGRTIAATAAVAGITAIDFYTAVRGSRGKGATVQLTGSTTIRKDPKEVYEHWRSMDKLPEFMTHVDEVVVRDDRISHWKVSAPFGQTVEWDAEIGEDVPGEKLTWSSIGDADVKNAGTVIFTPAPGDQGTELHVFITYDVPGGKLAEALARFFGEDPHQQIDDDLRRFKQVMEVGEVMRSDGAPYGKKARKEFPQRPAHPMSDKESTEVAT